MVSVENRARWVVWCVGALLCAACSSSGAGANSAAASGEGAEAAPHTAAADLQPPATPKPAEPKTPEPKTPEPTQPPAVAKAREVPAPPATTPPAGGDPRASAERLEEALMRRVARVKAYTLKRDFDAVFRGSAYAKSNGCGGGRLGLVRVNGAPCYPKDTKVRTLSSAETERLLAFFMAPEHYHEEERGWTAACFNPHHAWGFFDADGKLLAHMSLCLDCNYYVASRLLYPLEEVACAGREGCRRELVPSLEGADTTLDLNTGSIALSLKGAGAFRAVCRDLKLGRCDVSSFIEKMTADGPE